ncbi:hypothetical protein Clacol_003438 [Clathrus columnatus]|uniref:SMP-30/Gluconolactonase/LRE-like region domain-containing protein n=1 Tax=Clathrus columnatus TaxID=1419009 RepID=A0AAV5A9J6_9AGAM|nr:hypothetical protein Clacol_003438 [Clathrus columnatus]
MPGDLPKSTGPKDSITIGGELFVPRVGSLENTKEHVQVIDVLGLSVLGSDATFRNVTTPFNPTSLTAPFFQIWNESFLDILGPNPSVRIIAERDDFAFAHEAPVYDPIEDQGPLGMSNLTHNNQVSRISLKNIPPGPQNVTFTAVPITPPVQMVNGGTPFGSNILSVGSGRGNLPPSLVLVNPRPPFNSTTILDNMHGRQFNSLNDAKVHPKSGAIFFTDPDYGAINNFRPPPLLPNQVYRLDPQTREIHVVADGFDKCNGIAFSPDGTVAYVTDTGASTFGPSFNSTEPATVYAFDVDPTSQRFLNRRLLTWVDTGIPDGIQIDTKGNIYTSCGDGVQVFNPDGILLGKIFIDTVTSNHVFAGPGRMVILAETKVFLVEFAASTSLIDLQ